MPISPEIKQDLIDKIKAILDDKIITLSNDIKGAQESKNNDTKSSAGDKFETGREMIQAEISKNEAQLATLQQSLRTLLTISTNNASDSIDFGSLVQTNNGCYLISLGLGQIKLNGDSYYAISLASPIGKILKDKKVNDVITFQNRSFTILDIL